ncbi:MAG: hypothetical protein HKN91_16310 [Acidimicrobiia bacterium]|nr:hypothetical protein [Acidimicrobiia bacterium]
MADSLRAELLAIDGIAAAELEGAEDAPMGVRVQLAAGANAESVGIEVEKVLANHGMKSHVAGDDEPQKPAQRPVSDVPGPPPPPGAGGDAAILPMRKVAEANTPMVTTTEVEVPPAAAPELESVAVEESRDGIAIRVVVGGESVTRQVGSSPEGMDAAIVAALSQALDVEADHVTTQRADAGEAKIVTVLLEVAGRGQQVGSAVVVAGEAYATAHAAWKALTAQA